MNKLVLGPVYFNIGFLLLLLFIGALLFIMPKADGFLWLQIGHNESIISAARIITFMGDGAFLLILVAIQALWKSYKNALVLLIAWLIGSIVVQFMKQVIFPDALRPVAWFVQQGIQLSIPENLMPFSRNSFPSGHSATAASIASIFASWHVGITKELFFLVFLIIVAYTRILLFNHFPEDVLVGIIIGFLSAKAALKIEKRWESSEKLQKSIFKT